MDQISRLDESFAYQARRAALLDAERKLAHQRERVAALRRELPLDTVVDDYQFVDARTGVDVKLSEMIRGDRTLLMYHLMYGKAQTSPCPMCTMWIDGFDAVHAHVAQRADLVIVAAAEPDALTAHATARGWADVPLYSCGDNTFKFDLGSESDDGTQHPTISAFVSRDHKLVHVYSARPELSDDMHERGLDLLTPVWSLLDLTVDGRGDWYPSIDY